MRRALWLMVAVMVGILAPAASGAEASYAATAVGPAPRTVGTQPAGDIDPGSQVQVQLVLRHRDQGALDAILRSPSSKSLRSVALPSRFSPSASAVRAATEFLSSHGFAGISVSSNQELVDASARAGIVQQALGTHLARNRDTRSGRVFYSNDSAPSLPPALAAQVIAIHGLTNRPAARAAAAAPRIGTGAGGGYAPDQLKSIYRLNGGLLSGTDGTGQTIGLMEFATYNPAHITAYDNTYYPANAQPSTPVPVPVGPGASAACCGGQMEAELDIEVIQAIAPRANIRVYEAPNDDPHQNLAYQAMVSDRVDVISTSWGLCEQLSQQWDPGEVGTLHQIFQDAAVAGINTYAASGDQGAFDCRDPNTPNGPFDNTLAVDSPASDPNVVGVGGTSLTTLSDNLSYGSETAWSSNPPAYGGGGGLSVIFAAPGWQGGTGINAAARRLPDVSFDADLNTGISVFTYTTVSNPAASGWTVVGGTSAGAPAWAAYNALYNQQSVAAGRSRLGSAGAQLYAAASCHPGLAPFHDVTAGNNLAYSATRGFDMATGWGSMNGSDLAGALHNLLTQCGGYTLDGWGGIHPFGAAGPVASSAYWQGWDIARSLGLKSDASGGYVLDGWGGVHAFGSADPRITISAYWKGWDIARDLAVLPDGSGGYVLDGWGGIHSFATGLHNMPPAPAPSAYWPGWSIARRLALFSDGSGGYVLDGWGALHPFSTGRMPAPPQTTGYWQGWDIARGLTLVPGTHSGYVLDGWGSLHPFATPGAPLPAATSAASWQGWDIGRSVVAAPWSTPSFPAGWTLDGWGGVHAYGGAGWLASTGYWRGWDIARGIGAG